MAEHENQQQNGEESGGSTAPVKPQKKIAPKQPPARPLPPWKVMLHNDDVNEMDRVISVVLQLTPLSKEAAIARTLEAHETGVALLLVTHQERAELHVEQFASYGLTVTAEPEV